MSVRTGVPQPMPGMMPSPMGGMPPSPMGSMMGPSPIGGMPPMGGMPMPPGMNPQMPGAPSVPPGGVPGGRPGVGPGSASTGTLPSPSSVRQRAGFSQFAGSIQNAPAPRPPMAQGLGGAPMGPVGSMPQNVFAAPGQMMSPGRGSMPVPALPGRMPPAGRRAIGMAEGGVAAPRRTEIMGQDHMLAYITPEEGGILRALGGAGVPGPMGIPSYFSLRDLFGDTLIDTLSGVGRTFERVLNDSSSQPEVSQPAVDISQPVVDPIDIGTTPPDDSVDITGPIDVGDLPSPVDVTDTTGLGPIDVAPSYEPGGDLVPVGTDSGVVGMQPGTVISTTPAGGGLSSAPDESQKVDPSTLVQDNADPNDPTKYFIQDVVSGSSSPVGSLAQEASLVDPTIMNSLDYYRRIGEATRSGDIETWNALRNAKNRATGVAEAVDPYADVMAQVRETPGYAMIKAAAGPQMKLKADYGIGDIDAYNLQFYGDRAADVTPGYDSLSGGTYADVNQNGIADSLEVNAADISRVGQLNFPATPQGSVYQPTVYDIPRFVSGMGDIYGTRPVSFVGPPEANIQGILGDINLPARQESINIFDWLATPVEGMMGGGVAGRPFDGVSYFKKGGETEKQSRDYGARDADMSVGRAPSGGVSSGGGGRDLDADMDPFGGGGGSYGGGGGEGRNLDADMDPFGGYETGGGGDGGGFASPVPTPRPDRLAGTTGGGGGTSRTSGTTPVMSASDIAADTAATAPQMSGIEGFARRFGPDIVGAMIGGIPGLAVAGLGRMALSGEFGRGTSQSGIQGLSERSFIPGQGEGEGRSIFEQLLPEDELEKAVEDVVEETAPVVEPYKTETLDEILARITVPAQSIAPMGGNPFLPQGSQFARPMKDGGAVDYRAMARREAERVGLDPDIYERLIERESSYNPGAVSPKGARGLAQVMPGTARDPGFGVKPLADPFDPAESLRFGADYLAALRNEFGGDYGQALAAYNAGIGRVRKAGGIPDIKETRDYVDYILNNRSPAPRRRPANLASDTIRRPEPRPTLARALSEVMQPAPRKRAPVPQMRAPEAPMGREERMQQLQAASTPGGSLGAAADRFLSRLGMQ